MAISERGIQEITARSVAVMVHFHNVGRNPRTRELMEDDVRAISDLVKGSGLDVAEVGLQVFPTLHAELLARYTPKIADSLLADFEAALGADERPQLRMG